MARLTFLLLCLATIVAITSAQCNNRLAKPFFKRAVYDFTLDLIKRIDQETESHFVVSALSPWTLLAGISLGASDISQVELRQVLKLHPHQCFNNLYYNFITEVTGKPDNLSVNMLERSATIFVDDTLDVKQSFLDAVTESGICDARIVSFSEPQVTATIINQHVNSVTNEAIEEIVTPGDLVNMVLVMIDALYFKGTWKTAFPYEDTETSAFYNDKGQQIGDVSLMYVSGSFNLVNMQQIQASVLELPYGDDSRYSMLIFLPNRGKTLTRTIELLKRISISTIYILFNQQGPETVDVQIPRFKLSSDIDNLKELLQDMGLRSLFDNRASFPGISDYQVSLSNFIQKADIEVTEDGTVAAAATAALFEARMLPAQFVANRPFLFMIVDSYLHVPIFSGAYSKPSNF